MGEGGGSVQMDEPAMVSVWIPPQKEVPSQEKRHPNVKSLPQNF